MLSKDMFFVDYYTLSYAFVYFKPTNSNFWYRGIVYLLPLINRFLFSKNVRYSDMKTLANIVEFQNGLSLSK